MSNALGTTGKRRLAEREAIIESGLSGFLAIGKAMRDIDDERLYRDHYDTFDAYVNDRWGMSKSRAYQLMQALELSTIVEEAGALPLQNEAQLRALLPVRKDRKAIVEVIAKAQAEGDVTAANLSKYVAAYTPPEPRERKASSGSSESAPADAVAPHVDPDGTASPPASEGPNAAPSKWEQDESGGPAAPDSGLSPAPIDTTAREAHVHRCECGAEWHDVDLTAAVSA